MTTLKKLCEKIEKKQFSNETIASMKKAFGDIVMPSQVLETELKRKAEISKPLFLKRYE